MRINHYKSVYQIISLHTRLQGFPFYIITIAQSYQTFTNIADNNFSSIADSNFTSIADNNFTTVSKRG